MAGIPPSSPDQQERKQKVLDYLSDQIDSAFTAEELAQATGVALDEVKVAAEALAYENEIAKERTDGGVSTYRRKA